MKHWKFGLGVVYVITAWVFAYLIDFEESHMSASLVALAAMLGGMRMEEGLNERREEYLARKKNEN